MAETPTNHRSRVSDIGTAFHEIEQRFVTGMNGRSRKCLIHNTFTDFQTGGNAARPLPCLSVASRNLAQLSFLTSL